MARASRTSSRPRASSSSMASPPKASSLRGSKGALRFTLRTRGREAHSAYPHLGASAIEPMLRLLPELKTLDLPHDSVLGDTTVNIGQIRGGTEANIIPGLAEAEMMIRLVGDPAPVREIVDAWAAGRAEVEYGSYTPAMRFHTVPGFEAKPVAFATDVPLLTNSGDAALFGPGSIHVAHTTEEFVAVDELQGECRPLQATGSALPRFRADATMTAATERIPVAILGATGAVGQTFIRLPRGSAIASSRLRPANVPRRQRRPRAGSKATCHRTLRCSTSRRATRLRFPRSWCFRRSTRRRRVNSSRHSPARAGSPSKREELTAWSLSFWLVIPEVNAAHLQLVTAQRAARGWSARSRQRQLRGDRCRDGAGAVA